ncbi:MAG: hypothetical protein JXL97_02405 [Bacteroidales bacterium]|nr:hypothetical protein [Bacteroidales bacterium]
MKTQPVKYFIALILIALISLLLLMFEPILKEKVGGEWIIIWQLDLLVVPFLFFAWFIWVSEGVTIKQLVLYPILFVSYVGFTILWVVVIETHFVTDYYSIKKEDLIDKIMSYGFLIFFPFLTTLWNYFLARIEKRKLIKKEIYFLFITTFLIPLLIVMVYLLLGKMFSGLIQSDLVLGIKNNFLFAAILFTYILYEGFYFLWIKNFF